MADADTDNDPKTQTKPQTLLSILCHEPWTWDDGWSTVIFQNDGTGELICNLQLGVNVFLAADFLWIATPRTMLHLSSVVNSTAANRKTKDPPTIPVAQFTLEMTLLKGGVKRFQDGEHRSWAKYRSETFIRDEAFEPKVYRLSLEKGKFPTPSDLLFPKVPYKSWYASRLTFSPSPYPPRESWKTHEEGGFGAPLDLFRIWQWTSFCAEKIEKGSEEGEGIVERMGTRVQKMDRWVAGFI